MEVRYLCNAESGRTTDDIAQLPVALHWVHGTRRVRWLARYMHSDKNDRSPSTCGDTINAGRQVVVDFDCARTNSDTEFGIAVGCCKCHYEASCFIRLSASIYLGRGSWWRFPTSGHGNFNHCTYEVSAILTLPGRTGSLNTYPEVPGLHVVG